MSFATPVTPTSSENNEYLFRPISPAISLWSPELSPRSPFSFNREHADNGNGDDDEFGPPQRVYSFDDWVQPPPCYKATTTTANKPLVFRFDEWDHDHDNEDDYYYNNNNDKDNKIGYSKKDIYSSTDSFLSNGTRMSMDGHDSDLTIQQTNTTANSTSISSFPSDIEQQGRQHSFSSSFSSSQKADTKNDYLGAFRPVFTRFREKLTPLDTMTTSASTSANNNDSPFSSSASSSQKRDRKQNKNAHTTDITDTLHLSMRCEGIPRRDQSDSSIEEDEDQYYYNEEGEEGSVPYDEISAAASTLLSEWHPDEDGGAFPPPSSIEFEEEANNNSNADVDEDEYSAALSSPTTNSSESPIPEFILIHQDPIPLPAGNEPTAAMISSRRGGSWKKMKKSLGQIICKSKKSYNAIPGANDLDLHEF